MSEFGATLPGKACADDSGTGLPAALRDRVSAVVSGLLSLLGRDADPLQSREHILIHRARELRDATVANLLHRCDALRRPERFDQLLEVVLRDKAEWREKARLQLVEWFALCTDAQAVSRGRRYLGMYLN